MTIIARGAVAPSSNRQWFALSLLLTGLFTDLEFNNICLPRHPMTVILTLLDGGRNRGLIRECLQVDPLTHQIPQGLIRRLSIALRMLLVDLVRTIRVLPLRVAP